MEITRPDSLKISPPDSAVAGPLAPSGVGAAGAQRRGRGRKRALKNNVARRTLFTAAILLILLLIMIGVVLVREALPILSSQSLLTLLTSSEWRPTHLAFGLLPFIAGSFIVTFFAMILGVTPAVLSGIYLAEYTSSRRRAMVKPIVDLLAGIPSVVYGLWGVLFVVPLIREVVAPAVGGTLGQRFPLFAVTNPSGYSVLAGAIVLAIMVFPLIVAVTDEVLRNIPQQMRESTLALGATRWETTWCVVRHAGLPGIAAAVVLGFSRAFGETLAIMMVIGNTPIIPRSIFDAAYPLPALIANAYSEMMSVPQYQSALMLAALVLLVIVLLFNIGARRVVVRLGAKV
ncbi:phosphate ABC transporter permease subunit PstC [Promineifilum sp.]|uniref:phosphate ABC transporter permease subunit PstC n=1 Tax=Promineifilum sp. TaxID=2664178 RepID=UPI0035B1F087